MNLLGGFGPKNNSRKTGWARQRKEKRQLEAKARQAKHDALTIDEKIAKLDDMVLRAWKERNKLSYKRIIAEVKKRGT